MRASGFHGDAAPVPVLSVDDEDPLQLRLIDELHAVRYGEEAHAAGRLTPDVRVVESAALPPVLVQRARPVLERHLVERQIARQSGGCDRASSHYVPETLDPRNLTEIHAAIGPAWRRLRRPCRCGATAATPSTSRSAAALLASGTITPAARSRLRACRGSLRVERNAPHRHGKNRDDQTHAEQSFSHRPGPSSVNSPDRASA